MQSISKFYIISIWYISKIQLLPTTSFVNNLVPYFVICHMSHIFHMTHLKRSWCWERLKAREEGDDRGWDGWMASLAQQTWVWVNSKSWWLTGRSGMLHSMVSQRVGHDWVTELNWYFVNKLNTIALYCGSFFSPLALPLHTHMQTHSLWSM